MQGRPCQGKLWDSPLRIAESKAGLRHRHCPHPPAEARQSKLNISSSVGNFNSSQSGFIFE